MLKCNIPLSKQDEHCQDCEHRKEHEELDYCMNDCPFHKETKCVEEE